jgi:hypothetical protein
MNDPSPLDAIREQTGKIEDFLDTLSDPIKPYVATHSTGHETPPLKLPQRICGIAPIAFYLRHSLC